MKRPRMMVRTQRRDGESGSVLILALVFILVVGLLIVATANFAVDASVNTVNSRTSQVTTATVESEASSAIQAIRGAYFYPGCSSSACTTYAALGSAGTAYTCTPQPNTISSLGVYCIGFGGSANGTALRTVDFYVCAAGINCAASANSSKVLLFAEVAYRDLPYEEDNTDNQCTQTTTKTCGITLSITTWDIRLADV